MKQNDVRERIQLMTDPAYQGAYHDSSKDEAKQIPKTVELIALLQRCTEPVHLLYHSAIAQMKSQKDSNEKARYAQLANQYGMLLEDIQAAINHE